MTQNFIKLLKTLVVVIIMAAISFACYNAGKSSVYLQQYKYYNKTEALLDSIYNWNESFIDTIMETDAYYEYEEAKEAIN